MADTESGPNVTKLFSQIIYINIVLMHSHPCLSFEGKAVWHRLRFSIVKYVTVEEKRSSLLAVKLCKGGPRLASNE
jgi:hypothetical protein